MKSSEEIWKSKAFFYIFSLLLWFNQIAWNKINESQFFIPQSLDIPVYNVYEMLLLD